MTTAKEREALKKSEWALSVGLIALGAVVLVLQLRSLFVFPVFDSYLWWGDESWLMLEFRNQLQTGIMSHPLALASSLHHSTGFVFSNMWLTTILYAFPQLIVSSIDPVSIGRVMTAALGMCLIVSIFVILRTHHIPNLFAWFVVLLLVSSRTFFLTSHSARYDILTALAILWIADGLERLCRRNALNANQFFLLGMALPFTLLVTHHVLLLTGIIFAYAALKLAVLKKMSRISAFLGGALLATLFLVGVFWLSTGGFSLFAASPTGGFALNIHDIPILRPFSRSVQVSNITQRWQEFVTLAPFVLAFVVIVATVWLTSKLRKGSAGGPKLRTSTKMAVCIVLSWLFLESAAPTSYVVYIVPILLVASARSFERIISNLHLGARAQGLRLIFTFMLGVGVTILAVGDTSEATEAGKMRSGANDKACAEMHDAIMKDAAQQHVTMPLVLAFNPAVDRFLRYTDVRVMTTHFIEYPESDVGPESSIADQHVNYVLLYASRLKPDYMREVLPIASVASAKGTLIQTAVGAFTDIGVSEFDSPSADQGDTILLYRVPAN